MRALAFLLAAILLVALDQATKAIVVARLREGQAIFIGSVAIRGMLNRRGCGSRLQSGKALVALWAAECVILAIFIQLGPLLQSDAAALSLGAALGGAAGNLFDRLWRGGVVDFIDLGFWPVFNIADVAIVAGVVTALACL